MKRILFLSNNPVLKQKNIDVLAESGFNVTEASDAFQGLILVNRDGFAAIIIDEELSDIDGYRASQKIRKYSAVPIILLGTQSSEKVWTEVDNLGFDIYLKKPISPRELTSHTKAILRRTQLQKPAQELKPVEIQASAVTPLPEIGPVQMRETVEPRKPAEEEKPVKMHVEPTVVDKVAHQMQAEPPMAAEVVCAPSISRETYQGATAPAQAESIEAMVVDLERQVANIKTAIVRIGQLHKRIEEVKAIIRQQQQGLLAVENQLQEVSDQLEDILGSSRIS